MEYSDSRGQTGNFNSHAHVERDELPLFFLCCHQHFNSHAHVERDMLKWESDLLAIISTHTLTWSVTCKDDTVRIAGENFNSHAHVERDQLILTPLTIILYFNSHAHVERDPFKIQKENIVYNFNSHAHVERDLYCRTVLP